MTNRIGLREALKLLEELDPLDAIDNPELNQFMDDVQQAGQDVLSPLDTEYLLGAVAFLKSASIG